MLRKRKFGVLVDLRGAFLPTFRRKNAREKGQCLKDKFSVGFVSTVKLKVWEEDVESKKAAETYVEVCQKR